MAVKLRDLAAGDSACVTGFAAGDPGYRRRLLSMGVTPGAVLNVTRVAPLGDPVEVRVRGFALSLRKGEADALLLARGA